jgi:tRNA A37 threonylcarbamoyladenosine dehydratase
MSQFERLELLIKDKINNIYEKKILVIGLGGVGSYAAEALARSGIGNLMLCDADKVDVTNINRQLCALHSTVGQFKAEVMAKRALDIDPELGIEVKNLFFSEDTLCEFDFSSYDYVVDAIDSVPEKILLIKTAKDNNIPIISVMGTGNKTDPCAFEIVDIFKTQNCPLARSVRQRLRKLGIESLDVVFSSETPHAEFSSPTPASCSFVPSVAGLIAAGKVINTLIEKSRKGN